MTLKVDKKGVIRLGDSTTHGGSVVKVGSITEVGGIRIARIGDSVTCPQCKGTYTIVEGEPTYTDDGIPVALHGHKTSCGASLISSV
jgi:uncharacterized Zn-binding protein involved in type VI secretion